MSEPTEEQRRRRGLVGALLTLAVFLMICGVAVYWRVELAMPRPDNFRPVSSEKKP